MTEWVTIGRATGEQRAAKTPRRKPWGKTAIKAVVSCRGCLWTWKPTTGFGHEPCPKCGKVKSVRDRTGERKPNIPQIREWRSHRPGYAGEKEREYRDRARLLVGAGVLACTKCGCSQTNLLEINHKNGGGGKEHKKRGSNQFYRDIALLRRTTADLELLCKPCNAVHALELIHGSLPFTVVWGGSK